MTAVVSDGGFQTTDPAPRAAQTLALTLLPALMRNAVALIHLAAGS